MTNFNFTLASNVQLILAQLLVITILLIDSLLTILGILYNCPEVVQPVRQNAAAPDEMTDDEFNHLLNSSRV